MEAWLIMTIDVISLHSTITNIDHTHKELSNYPRPSSKKTVKNANNPKGREIRH